MKDNNCISDSENYIPTRRVLKRHKDDMQTLPKKKKMGKRKRNKQKCVINKDHEELIKATILKSLLKRRRKKRRKFKEQVKRKPNSSFHSSLYDFDVVNVVKKCRTANDNISLEINNALDIISQGKSLNGMELERLEVTSLYSKKKSVEEITSRLKKLNFYFDPI